MQSRFYSPDKHRAEKVHDLFATIARRYDLLNDLMSARRHRAWKQRLVELATEGGSRLSAAIPAGRGTQAAPTWRVLDLCCGTGDIALRFARRGARVVGVDFSVEMLGVARARSGVGAASPPRPGERNRGGDAAPTTTPVWVRADALRLPFAHNTFDIVSVGYGVRNLADIERGLREIQRVLRPGGRLVSLDFGKPESAAWRRVYFGYLRTVLPVLGRLFCGDPDTYAYVLASLANYPAQRGIKSLMESCGYADCGFVEILGGAMAVNFGVKTGGEGGIRTPDPTRAG